MGHGALGMGEPLRSCRLASERKWRYGELLNFPDPMVHNSYPVETQDVELLNSFAPCALTFWDETNFV